MADISSISGAAARAYHASASTRAHQASSVAGRMARASQSSMTTRENDLFEISDAAHYLAKLKSMPDVRQDVVDRVKRQINNGEIDTPEKLEHALDEMISDILGE
jgi:hypothetical protein